MAWVPRYFYDVFLSYAHADNEGPQEWVGSFKTELEFQIRANLAAWGRRDATVWWDEHRIKPGDAIRGTIIDALNRSATVVSLCSPEYRASGYCMKERAEFERACSRDGGIKVENTSRLLNAIVLSTDDVRHFAGGPGSLYADFSSSGFPPTLQKGDGGPCKGRRGPAQEDASTIPRRLRVASHRDRERTGAEHDRDADESERGRLPAHVGTPSAGPD